jgi:hypothetical protein
MAARPSTYILRKAWSLGQDMARKERRLRPDLWHTRTCPSYMLFQQFHRHELESRSAFQPWEEKLQRLIEREGNGRGVRIDDPRLWEAFYTYFGEPIRDVFWAGWEEAFRLQELYEQEAARIEMSRQGMPALLHVANPPASAGEEQPAEIGQGQTKREDDRTDPMSQAGRSEGQQVPQPGNRKAAG